jgi:hypothetical protein
MAFLNVACEKCDFRRAPEIKHIALCRVSKEFFNTLLRLGGAVEQMIPVSAGGCVAAHVPAGVR